MRAFPISPPVSAGEQLALPLDGTIAGRYAAWRKTPVGMQVFLEVERRLLARSNRGDARVEINAIWSAVRADFKVGMNHNFRAAAARELIERHPELAAKIQTRRRRAV